MSNTLQVFAPSLLRVHDSGTPRRNASSVAGVRARSATLSSKSYSMVILGLKASVAAISSKTKITDGRISPQKAPRSHRRGAQLIRHIGPADTGVLLRQNGQLARSVSGGLRHPLSLF